MTVHQWDTVAILIFLMGVLGFGAWVEKGKRWRK